MDNSSSQCQSVPRRFGLAFFIVFVLFFVLDQWTKLIVSANMRVGETIELPVRIFQWTYVRNCGSAFGMMEDAHMVFLAAAIMSIALIYWQFPMICRVCGMWGSIISGAIVAGAIGNLVDRLRLGYVVDMIDFRWWPVFNVADIGISVGMTILVIMLIVYDTDNMAEAVPSSKEPN